MKKVVIFDMDGVIVDSEPIHNFVDLKIFEKFSINISKTEMDSFVGLSERKVWSYVREKYNLSESVEELVRLKDRMFTEKISEIGVLKPIDGIKDLLETLKEKGIICTIASSSSKHKIEFIINRLGISSYFDYVVSGEEVKSGKPAPDIFLKVTENYKHASNFLVIEDAKNGVMGAKAANLKCVGYNENNQGCQDLSLADIVIESFNSKNINRILDLLN